MHSDIEQHLNGMAVPEPHSPEFQQFLKFEEEVLKKENLQVRNLSRTDPKNLLRLFLASKIDFIL